MSLPASQQRALDAIDRELRGADIRLASMFRVFTEVTRLEKMPPVETFQPVRWWTRAGRRAARRQRACTFPGCRRPGHRGPDRPWPGRYLAGGRLAGRLGTVLLVPLLLAAALSLLLISALTTRPAVPRRCSRIGCGGGRARYAGRAGPRQRPGP